MKSNSGQVCKPNQAAAENSHIVVVGLQGGKVINRKVV